jgi:hypothetical protein
MISMEAVVAIIVGVCLAAACGFRVFVPLLCLSLAARANLFELAQGWSWLGEWPALVGFSVATAIEVAAFYVPWLDNLLDTIASPAAVVAGIVVMAASIAEMDPFLRWSLAIIAGGGAAGLTQALSVLVRGTSTATTGGVGNFVVSSVELVLSALLSALAVVAPFVGIALFVVVVIMGFRIYRRRKARQAILAAKAKMKAC